MSAEDPDWLDFTPWIILVLGILGGLVRYASKTWLRENRDSIFGKPPPVHKHEAVNHVEIRTAKKQGSGRHVIIIDDHVDAQTQTTPAIDPLASGDPTILYHHYAKVAEEFRLKAVKEALEEQHKAEARSSSLLTDSSRVSSEQAEDSGAGIASEEVCVVPPSPELRRRRRPSPQLDSPLALEEGRLASSP